ncbi:uncharacterized protein LOC114519386 [Dendronephthya gigantea]|uniref:uncharacterized protein LOC114519386 n=1 Tax=Dendronephthya gigantea TaxID=151771 RepID=UPI00106B85BA|nr:uncharacterized protein LOC114519386 [Dendronephthya gigantea]
MELTVLYKHRWPICFVAQIFATAVLANVLLAQKDQSAPKRSFLIVNLNEQSAWQETNTVNGLVDISLNVRKTEVILLCSPVPLATVVALNLNVANNQTALEHQKFHIAANKKRNIPRKQEKPD